MRESTGYFSHLELWILEQPMLFSPNKIKVIIERRYNISDHILDQILTKKRRLKNLVRSKKNLSDFKNLERILHGVFDFFKKSLARSKKNWLFFFFGRIWSKMWSEMLYLLSITTLILLGLNSIGCSKIHNSRCEKYPVLSLLITHIIN